MVNFRLRNGSSFEGIAYQYNDEHFGFGWDAQISKEAEESEESSEDGKLLERRRLAEAWLKFHLIMLFQEMKRAKIPEIPTRQLNDVIESNLEEISSYFTRKWSAHDHVHPGRQGKNLSLLFRLHAFSYHYSCIYIPSA